MAVALKKIVIRHVHAQLVGFAGEAIATVSVIVADELPQVVLWDGDVFLRAESPDATIYAQVKPYRADLSL